MAARATGASRFAKRRATGTSRFAKRRATGAPRFAKRRATGASRFAGRSFTPELLGRTASSGLVLVALEVFVLKVAGRASWPTTITNYY